MRARQSSPARSGSAPQHLHLAAVAATVSLEDLHGRGLACAVRPEECERLAALHVEVDVVDGDVPAVGPGEVANPDRRVALG